jgi:hypothetical protein
MIPAIVYVLCGLTSLSCAWLLLRGWRRTGARLLFWSGLCFAGFTANNVMLFIDLVLLPMSVDLGIFRNGLNLISGAALLFGLIWEVE